MTSWMFIRGILLSYCIVNFYGFIGTDFNVGKI